MKRFMRMLNIELMKLHKRSITWVFAILVIFFICVGTGINFYMAKVFFPNFKNNMQKIEEQRAEETKGTGSEEDAQSEIEAQINFEMGFEESTQTNQEYREELVASIESMKQLLEEKSPEVRESSYRNAIDELAVLDYKLEHGILKPDEFYEDYNPASIMMDDSEDEGKDKNESWQFIKSSDNSLVIMAFSVVVLALSVSGEFEKGTMKSMIIRPVSRGTILLAKFKATLVYMLSLFIISTIVKILINLLFFGVGNPSELVVFALLGKAFAMPIWAYVLMMVPVQFFNLILPLTIALLLAVLSRSSAVTIGVTLVMFFIVNPLVTSFGGYLKVLRFLPFPNMSWASYFTGGIALDYTNIVFSIVVAAVYSIIFYVLSLHVFKHRDL